MFFYNPDYLSVEKSLDKRFWLIWLLIFLPVFFLFLITLDKGPYLHADEFVIVDLGRYILNPNSTWSIAWITEIKEPAFLISYLGVVFQELIYGYFGQYGPRLFALIGAIAAASALMKWLLVRNVSRHAALFIGLIFLLDPLFVQSFTIGRIDSWSMFLCFNSGWIIHGSKYYSSRRRIFNLRLLVAGLMAGLAVFVWPSAIFLFPLIIMELFQVQLKTGRNESKMRGFFGTILIWIFGTLFITSLLFLPISRQLSLQVINILEAIYANSHSGSNYELGGILHNLKELPRVLKFSPFVVLGASIGFIKQKNRDILLATIFVTILMVGSLVYINRVQYLIPYFLLAIGSLFQKGAGDSISQKLRNWLLIVPLVWSIGLSVGARTYLVFAEENLEDRQLLHNAAVAMVGEGEHKVYIPYEFYYSGRSLNWQMYRAYLANNNPLNLPVLQQILPHVDYFILNQPSVEFENEMVRQGFRNMGEFRLYKDPPKPFNGITTNDIRLRNLYSVFKKPYGPYKLYKRI